MKSEKILTERSRLQLVLNRSCTVEDDVNHHRTRRRSFARVKRRCDKQSLENFTLFSTFTS